MKKIKNILLNILIISMLSPIIGGCAGDPDENIIGIIESISTNPMSISFMNNLHVNNSGGHLQGIQYYQYLESGYLFLTGSSDTHSYYAVVNLGEVNSVISVNNILQQPFKHAGGFQIHNNLMAIGIEDNSERDKSKVFIYSLDDPKNLPKTPIEIVDRVGTNERATAGCVGITEIDDYVILLVGDWNSEHLDFYRIKKENIGIAGEKFELVYTCNMKKYDKSKWVDNSWLPYQNINFIKDEFQNLYLAAMVSNGEENILDLFKIDSTDYSIFTLKKIHSKIFLKSEDSNFNSGAGIYHDEAGNIKVYSCGSHIEDVTIIGISE